MANGRIDARYTVPSGGWVCRCTNTAGGPTSVTLAAGNYYASALITAFQTAINAAMGAPDFTVSVANTEGGTGRVTISVPSGTCSVQWDGLNSTSTDLRDALGFTGNISAAATSTGSNAMMGMWLPDSPLIVPTYDLAGFYSSDLRQQVAPDGGVLTLVSNSFREWKDGARWSHVSKERALGTTTYPMPFDTFWYQTQLGGKSFFAPGSRLAIYSNATSSTLLGYYQALGLTTTQMIQAVTGWDGRWGVHLPRLISQAS